ncbi:MAG: hypothetical protein KIT56_01730 [Gammaproteobacteria bacterium]|nr:hypothetical protein [Gammaproteobacteria bacterium]MCW5582604.1 hypothetical protein [Gammaproteobacteria bacterium]
MSMSHKQKLFIREPTLEDEKIFLSVMQRSRSLHHPWVKSPETSQKFSDYFQRFQQSNQKSFLVCGYSGNIVPSHNQWLPSH